VSDTPAYATALARAFLAGDWNRDALRARGREVFGRQPRWLTRLVAEVLELYHRPPLDRPRELADVIDTLLTQRRVRTIPPVERWFTFEPQMGRMRWPVRPLCTIADVAAFAELDVGRLDWIADARALERCVQDDKLRNYRYTWHARTASTVRVLERPKSELKRVQRLVLREILDLIPPHDASHGFRRGRSVVTHARRHVGQHVVLRFDLESFFASVSGGRIYGVFREAGYPEAVAHVLTALTVNVVPQREWAAVPRPDDPRLLAAHARLGLRLATPHLPQGAPTSPALAALAAFNLDRRLAALATAYDATYTRYADDLAVSGNRGMIGAARGLRDAVREIVRDEGFRLNERKSQLMTRAGRQELCGVVVNAHPNVTRRDYDLLKATLHQAAMRGPRELDRAQVLGKIAWVESVNARRGARLRRAFDAIAWPEAA
jgi:RNA-directed DNA polymerase